MLRRTSLPAGRLAISVRPSDGRYMLCPFTPDPNVPLQVIDVETGKALCEVALPVMWDHFASSSYHMASGGSVYWLNDQEALCTGLCMERDSGAEFHWWRINYRTGKLLKEGTGGNDLENSMWFRRPELTEGGKRLLLIDGSGKGTWGTLSGEWIDTATLKSEKFGAAETDREPNGDFGLVPGGKYFHLGSYIFDRQTLKLVAAKDFPRYTLGAIAFSPDGGRYAVAIVKARGRDEWPGIDEWSWYSKYSAVVRVQETLTGKTLLAFSPRPPSGDSRFPRMVNA